MGAAADRVRAFLSAISAGAGPEVIAGFYAPGAVQIEYPNRLLPQGATRDRAALQAAAAAGAKVVASQGFEIVSLTEAGSFVALEAVWTGVLAVPVGSLAAGDRMTAHFAQFFEFDGDLILRQRNYDCFDAF